MTRHSGRHARLTIAASVAAAAAIVAGPAAARATAPPAEATTVVVDDTGLVAMSVPAGWVDVATAPNDYGAGAASPSILASPDNQALVNSFEVSGVLVTVPSAPGTHEELMGSFGLTEGCTSLSTEPFADGTLTGLIQRGDDCAGTGAVWRTIIGDTADGQTVVAQGQAPSPLGLAELNATLASVVVVDSIGLDTPQHEPAGTSTPMAAWTDATSSISFRVPAAWTDVALEPVDFDTGAAQPYMLASADQQVFFDSFDASGLGVTIPNWDATHEELLKDFGLAQGCTTIEIVPFDDDTLSGLLQQGSDCGGVGAEWRAVAGDTVDGLTVVIIGQTSTLAGLSTLEAAIGGVSITAEFGGEDDVVVGDTKDPEPTAPAVPATPAVPTTPAVPATPAVSTTLAVPTAATSFEEVFGPEPDGFNRIVDDTGTLTMLAPESWTWVDTYELDIDDGKPRIMATTDLGAFQGDGDVGGALLIGEAYQADPASLVDDFRRDESCATNSDLAYDDGTYAGWMWIGESCGPSSGGTWSVIVASPEDQSRTLRLHLRAAPGEDAQAEQVLSSFSAVEPGAVAPGALPPRVLADGATPDEIATAFMFALGAGDGAAACSLLDPSSTGNMGLSLRNCAERFVTYYDPAVVAQVQIVGESTTSEECSASDSSDPTATSASVEFALGTDRGCVSMVRDPGGEWGIEDYSGSVLRSD